ncbi:MAG: WG repeat-containing protein [bacterium]
MKNVPKYGYINKKGEFVVEPTLQKAGPFRGGVAQVKKNNKIGFINRDGEWVIEPRFRKVKSIGGDNGQLMKGSLKDGLKLIQARRNVSQKTFKSIKSYSQNRAAVENMSGKWGYLNEDGELVISPRFNKVKSFTNGVARVKTKKGWGVINSSGTFLVSPEYQEVKPVSNNLFKVKKNGLWGVVSKEGKIIVEPKFEHIGKLKDGRFTVRVIKEKKVSQEQ